VTPYDELKIARRRESRDAVRQARKAEMNRRHQAARRRVAVVMAHRHPEEFRELLKAELEAVHRLKGPLPGD